MAHPPFAADPPHCFWEISLNKDYSKRLQTLFSFVIFTRQLPWVTFVLSSCFVCQECSWASPAFSRLVLRPTARGRSFMMSIILLNEVRWYQKCRATLLSLWKALLILLLHLDLVDFGILHFLLHPCGFPSVFFLTFPIINLKVYESSFEAQHWQLSRILLPYHSLFILNKYAINYIVGIQFREFQKKGGNGTICWKW